MEITILPGIFVDAGNDKSMCANEDSTQVFGNVNGATTNTGVWSTTLGTGTFSTPTVLNSFYQPSNQDTTNGNVILTLTSTNNAVCPAVKDSVIISINPPILVDAGVPFDVCGNNATGTLVGVVSGAGGGAWSTTFGTGTFTNSTQLTASYTASIGDTIAGSVIITLSSTGNGVCNEVKDSTIITIIDPPKVNAGLDSVVCANNGIYGLNGLVFNGTTTGVWSTNGTGGFSPNNSDLAAIYTPSNDDTLAGTIDIVLSTTNNGLCSAVRDTFELVITDAPVVEAGTPVIVCANNANVSLSGIIGGGASKGQWSTLGSGSFSPHDSLLTGTYVPSSTDTATGTIKLVLTSTDNGKCNPVTDTLLVVFTPAPKSIPGDPQTICTNNDLVSLGGSVTIASGGVWATSGTGSFADNSVLFTSYNPSTNDTVNGSIWLFLETTGNAACNSVTDSIEISFIQPPVVFAGVDTVGCSNNGIVDMSGIVSNGSSTGQWLIIGTGSMSPNDSDLTATYTPSSNDIAADSVQIILVSTNNGICAAIRDTMQIVFTPAPNPEANGAYTGCANNPAIPMLGSVTGGASTGIWTTSGTGSFDPSDAVLGPIYVPSVADTIAGFITIALTSTNNGLCLAESDTTIILIESAPLVDAGEDQTICANIPTTDLDGSVVRATGGQWTTLGSGSFAASSSLITQYFPSTADTSAGSVKLVLETTGNGLCNSITDTVEITFLLNTIQITTFTPDTNMCSNNANVQVTGTVVNSSASGTGGLWTSSGDGVFNNPSNLTTMYTAGPADTALGTVILTLASTNNGICSAVTSDIEFVVHPAPNVNSGSPDTLCANNANWTLNGTISGATSGQWSSNGTGTFVTSDTTLTPTYIPSDSDTGMGEVIIVLSSSTAAGCDCNCLPVSSATTLTFTAVPVVNAGADQLVCAAVPQSQLFGDVTGATTSGSWSTLGSGSFDDANLLNAMYFLSAADVTNGSVELVLESTNNGECVSETDTISISIITSLPLVVAGNDTSVCANNSDVPLFGSVSSGSTTGIWTSTGTGIFVSADSILTNTYLPSLADDSVGSISLVLTATNSCPISDTIDLIITPAPFVDAGINQVLCAGDDSLVLAGNVSLGATTGLWSTTGSGTFNPNTTDFNATYLLSPPDTIAAGATFVLESTNNGNCLAETDTMFMTITTIPVVNAIADDSICASAPAVLTGSVIGGASSGIWTSAGTGNFTPSDTSLFTNYMFSNSDTAAGIVKIYLTSTNACINFTDSVEIEITPAPHVDAGNDELVCANNSLVTLNGSIDVVTSTGQWSTLGSGSFFPNDSTLNASYQPSQNDIDSGQVTLVLTSTNNEDCLPVTDTIIVFIGQAPIVDAGNDINVCLAAPNVIMGSSVSGGTTTGIWSSAGTGSFSPDFLTANATYVPSTADTANGNVQLILTSTNNGTCLAEVDTIEVVWTETPNVIAGTDTSLCFDGNLINLNGIITGGTSIGYWQATNGNGFFTADSSDLSGQYIPASSDESISVELLLSSTSGCTIVTDTRTITFNSSLNAAFDFGPACDNLNMDFTDTSSINFGNIATWNWDFGNNTADLVQHPSITFDSIGTYNVQLIVESDSGCTDSVQKQVVIRSILADFEFNETCLSEGVDFSDASIVENDTITSWNWNYGDSNSATTQDNEYFYSTDGTYNVTLIIQTASGCEDSSSQTIVVNPQPTAGFILEEFITRLVEFEIVDSSFGAESWSYNFGDGTILTEASPTHTYEGSGQLEVIQIVTNEFGCKDSLVKIADIDIIYPPVLPSAFTPNGDGENDFLLIRGGPIKDGTLLLKIYNEWGTVIFESTSQDDGWDGKHIELDQPIGVYIYTLEAETINGLKHKLFGEVTLLR
jgi:gliding motility-associated-like protein